MSLRGAAYIVLSAVFFGAFAIFIRMVYASGGDAYTMLLLRFALSALMMAPVVAAKRERLPAQRWSIALLLMGALGYFGQSLAYALALNHATPALVALLLYLYPACVVLLDALINRAPITKTRMAALALALLGCALTVTGDVTGSTTGIAIALAACVIYSVYIIVGNRVMRHTSSLMGSQIVMIGAAASFGVLVLANGWRPPQTPTGWGAIAGIVGICTVTAMLLFFAGLQRVGPANASMLSTFEPVTTMLLSVLVLGETLGGLQLVGGALILLSALVLAKGS